MRVLTVPTLTYSSVVTWRLVFAGGYELKDLKLALAQGRVLPRRRSSPPRTPPSMRALREVEFTTLMEVSG